MTGNHSGTARSGARHSTRRLAAALTTALMVAVTGCAASTVGPTPDPPVDGLLAWEKRVGGFPAASGGGVVNFRVLGIQKSTIIGNPLNQTTRNVRTWTFTTKSGFVGDQGEWILRAQWIEQPQPLFVEPLRTWESLTLITGSSAYDFDVAGQPADPDFPAGTGTVTSNPSCRSRAQTEFTTGHRAINGQPDTTLSLTFGGCLY